MLEVNRYVGYSLRTSHSARLKVSHSGTYTMRPRPSTIDVPETVTDRESTVRLSHLILNVFSYPCGMKQQRKCTVIGGDAAYVQ